jgi:hypothetical protein
MDHLEDDQQPSTGPQQEQEQQQQQSQVSQQQQPPQQWPQQNQPYAAAAAAATHQSQYGAQTRRQFPVEQQDMATSQGGAAIMQQQQQQAAGAPGGQVNYPVHQSVSASYASYPQHYQQVPSQQQQQQLYHQQAQQMAALQQPLHIQQPLPLGVPPMIEHPYIQPTHGRLPADRPIVKLSVSLIDTYKHINRVYYEERDARRAARAAQKAQKGQGANNNGWDDDNYDYIVTSGELFYGHYVIKERIGKGSFGQVVRAVDTRTNQDVAIKIIKSKKPFLLQAKTEIELLTHLGERDPEDRNNIGKCCSSRSRRLSG